MWRIANGQNVRIWRDRWIVRDPTGGLISPKGRCRCKWVSELMGHNGNWDNSKLQQFFLPIDICEIQKIRPSHRLGEDFIAWAQEKSGVFSVRSAYRLASDDLHNGRVTSSSHHPDGRRDGWKALWSCSAPPKVLSFGWHLANNSLATWCNKNKQNLEPNALCPICSACEEDSFHTFCSCINARTLWRVMASKWTLPDVVSIKPTGPDWFIQLLCELDEPARVRLLMLFWRIWYVQNEIVHSKPPPCGCLCQVSIELSILLTVCCDLPK